MKLEKGKKGQLQNVPMICGSINSLKIFISCVSAITVKSEDFLIFEYTIFFLKISKNKQTKKVHVILTLSPKGSIFCIILVLIQYCLLLEALTFC